MTDEPPLFWPLFWRLDGHAPVPCDDVEAFARMMRDTAERQVALDQWVDGAHSWRVSTVFLGLDHRFTGRGPPLLFETVASRDNDMGGVMQRRYATWDEAEAGHRGVVAVVKAGRYDDEAERAEG